jgi:hypothetical protein
MSLKRKCSRQYFDLRKNIKAIQHNGEITYRIFMAISVGKQQFPRRWRDNIKMDLKKLSVRKVGGFNWLRIGVQ